MRTCARLQRPMEMLFASVFHHLHKFPPFQSSLPALSRSAHSNLINQVPLPTHPTTVQLGDLFYSPLPARSMGAPLSPLLPSLSGFLNCSMVVLTFIVNIHLWVSTYCMCLSGSGLFYSG